MKILDKKWKWPDIVQAISPVLIDPTATSITVSLSKRFLLFQLLDKMGRAIEDQPHLNFVSILKSYKILGRFIYGSIHEIHRDRNSVYFKNFFASKELYTTVKHDIEWVYRRNKDINITITKWGVIVYDNYKRNAFNPLLMTIHSGEWMPKDIEKKQELKPMERHRIEDTDTHRIFGDLVLQKHGIWIDNKLSRFAVDFNRSSNKAIYENESEKWLDKIWKEELSNKERKKLLDIHKEFYFILSRVLEAYQFNIIFDGHSMLNKKGRPDISFGTEYISNFYMPIVKSMRAKLSKLGYNVAFNNPYAGGFILKWLKDKYPDRFIFSMEINKRLYMTRDMKKVIEKKREILSEKIHDIFDIEVE